MELRAYFFNNMYLSSIQQGIQPAHVIGDMFIKYRFDSSDRPKLLEQWADEYKTMIVLNAGYASEIESLVDMFTYGENPYPWAYFRESQDAMQQCITSVGIILPEFIWEGARQLREGARVTALIEMRESGQVEWSPGGDISKPLERHDISKWEFQLIERLNNYGLAR